MAKRNLKFKTLSVLNPALRLCAFGFSLLAMLGLCSCSSVIEFVRPEGPPDVNEIYYGYRQVELKKSSSADALAAIHLPEYELLSQDKSIIASAGEKKKGYKSWFNMVAFDEDSLTAQRKYFFLVDERPKLLFIEPWEGLMFNCEAVLGSDVLDKPYSNENARRIATLRQVLKNLHKDIDQVGKDNKTLATSGMLINQALETVLVKFDASPALAVKLDRPGGVEFEHTSFDKGKIEMLVAGDIATVKIKLGSFAKMRQIQRQEKVEAATGKDANSTP